MHRRAVQSQPHARIFQIQLAVIRPRRNHVFHRGARHRRRNQRPHQQPRHRRIPIRKMKNVWLFLLPLRQPQPLKSRVQKRLIIVRRLVASPRRHRINPHSEQIVRKRLEKFQRIRRHFAELRQIVRVADRRQASAASARPTAHPCNRLFRCRRVRCRGARIRKRRLRQKLRPRRRY